MQEVQCSLSTIYIGYIQEYETYTIFCIHTKNTNRYRSQRVVPREQNNVKFVHLYNFRWKSEGRITRGGVWDLDRGALGRGLSTGGGHGARNSTVASRARGHFAPCFAPAAVQRSRQLTNLLLIVVHRGRFNYHKFVFNAISCWKPDRRDCKFVIAAVRQG